ncbi:MAG: DNA/RNA non-specific endonuclease, partial [Bacteroidales bacterium]|nr:DNA/RNA non-specific endonuclease [Bacteroidales bacterium]
AWYKALLRTKGGSTGKRVDQCSADELKCAAFILPHTNWKEHNPDKNDLYTIEELEALTGLTFFVNVPNAPKSTVTASDWGL